MSRQATVVELLLTFKARGGKDVTYERVKHESLKRPELVWVVSSTWSIVYGLHDVRLCAYKCLANVPRDVIGSCVGQGFLGYWKNGTWCKFAPSMLRREAKYGQRR